jgi:hypothetical protein
MISATKSAFQRPILIIYYGQYLRNSRDFANQLRVAGRYQNARFKLTAFDKIEKKMKSKN